MKNTLISLLIYLPLCAILNAQYSGIYKGDYFEDTPTNGPDEGIFIALLMQTTTLLVGLEMNIGQINIVSKLVIKVLDH